MLQIPVASSSLRDNLLDFYMARKVKRLQL